MEVAGIFVALASEGLIVFPLSFLCERIQYNRQMGKYFNLVYPRTYGVDLGVVEVTYSYRGLSPRVRGRFDCRPSRTRFQGFIPVCAG